MCMSALEDILGGNILPHRFIIVRVWSCSVFCSLIWLPYWKRYQLKFRTKLIHQGFQYISNVPVLHYLQAVLYQYFTIYRQYFISTSLSTGSTFFLKFEHFSWILQHWPYCPWQVKIYTIFYQHNLICEVSRLFTIDLTELYNIHVISGIYE
jgi:hypothetical protein